MSQIGLVIFMFLVGLEMNGKELKRQGSTVLLTSTASIAVPFVLACCLAGYRYPGFSGPSVSLLSFALLELASWMRLFNAKRATRSVDAKPQAFETR